MKNNAGVSIIVLARREDCLIDRLLNSFIEVNTHQPVEFIILDQLSTDISEDVIKRYASRLFIHHFNRCHVSSIAASNNYAVQKARNPYLLFVSEHTVFTSDVLSLAVDKLTDPLVCSVVNRQNRSVENNLAGKSVCTKVLGISGMFLFCRKADFGFIGGFDETYSPGMKDDNFFLDITARLNYRNFLRDGVSHASLKGVPKQRVLFVLPQPLDSNCGYHAARLSDGLCVQGTECVAAVPQIYHSSQTPQDKSSDVRFPLLAAYTYREVLENENVFSDGRGPDIIHAWTPREGVRRFVATLISHYPCPVVLHLEDNEEYLTETAIGRSFDEITKLSLTELNKIIPDNRYHPVHGRKWLEQVQGLTMITQSLEKFNFGELPSLSILPTPDPRLFYPRPVNWELRHTLKIPDNHRVIVYAGNVHAGNRDEVATLYQAVEQLNLQGMPTTLIRTGIDAVPLLQNGHIAAKRFEKHLGWVPREAIPDMMAAADIFVQPGKPGAFNDYRVPCKLPEYFALGRPVILPRSNLGVHVQYEQARVIETADVKPIVQAVMDIAGNNDLATRLADNALFFYSNVIGKLFCIHELTEFYSAIRESFISGCRKGRPENRKSNFHPALYAVSSESYSLVKGVEPLSSFDAGFALRSPLFDAAYYHSLRKSDMSNSSCEDHYKNVGMLQGIASNRRIAGMRVARLFHQPLISILMPVYNTSPGLLKEAVQSVIDQIYPNWELCIQDDCSTSKETVETLADIARKDHRIHVGTSRVNGGISAATNAALMRASGAYVAMMDHDDLLVPDSLAEIVSVYNDSPETDVFYTDQSCVDDNGVWTMHHFKPEWSPWMFRGVMFVGHLLVVRKEIALAVGGFDTAFDFVQDFEFMLRVSEKTHRIKHIPKVLYYWRQTSTSVAGGGKKEIDFGRLQSEAVNNHLNRLGLPVRGREHPTRGHRLILEPINDGKDIAVRVFVMPVSGVRKTDIHRLIERTNHSHIQWTELSHDDLMNPSRLQPLFDACECTYWAFVHSGCLPEKKDWLSCLLSYLSLPGVGAVGPVFLRPDGRIASAGMVLTSGGARPAMEGRDPAVGGYAGSLNCLREVSALPPDWIVLNKSMLQADRGVLPEYGLAYNLLDTGIRGMQTGLASLVVPYVQVRWSHDAESSLHLSETGRLFWLDQRHRELAAGDPYYNRNLDSDNCDYGLAVNNRANCR